MQNRVNLVFSIILQLAAFTFATPVQAADLSKQFVTTKLASGLSISLPASWKILSGNELLAVNTTAGAVLDLSGYAKTAAGVETILTAMFPDPELYSSVTITVLRMAKIKPTSASSFSDVDLQSLEPQLRQVIEAGTSRLGEKIIRFSPVTKENIGQNTVLHTSYVRTSQVGDTLVHLYKFFGNGKVYDVVLSGRLAMQKLNQPVLQKMVHSVAVGP